MSDTVQSDVTGRVAEVTIDRPDKLNALTTETNTALRERFEALEHRDIDVVILKSAGDRAFVAGADINEISDLTTREFIEFQRNGRETNDTIASHPAIVIAAVNGIAFGGGFELALASDMIVAGEGASFATPEVQIGLVPGGGATQRLPEVVGPNKAKELLTTGDPITAAEGEDLGLINCVVDDDSVEEEARDLAGDIVGNAPLAIREAKTLVEEGQNMPLPEGLSYEQSVTFTLFESDDVTEGIASFVEDRDPEFAGQ